MGRIMAIDYGSKRTGIAVTDPDRIIATGLTTVQTSEIVSYIKKYLNSNTVDIIVVGEPKSLNNNDTHSTKAASVFASGLMKHFPEIKIDRLDERFTSALAFNSMIVSGMKRSKRADKSLVDEISATILLQDYMEKMKNSKTV